MSDEQEQPLPTGDTPAEQRDTNQEIAESLASMTLDAVFAQMSQSQDPIVVLEMGEEGTDTIHAAVVVMQGPATRLLLNALMESANELAEEMDDEDKPN